MRQIKFRAWDKDENGMRSWENLTGHVYKNPQDSIFNDPDYILMQFTGLIDKNDKEIYEGDILNYVGFNNKVHRGKVEFFNGAFILRHATGYSPFLHSAGKNDEVVGNIYENPELL